MTRRLLLGLAVLLTTCRLASDWTGVLDDRIGLCAEGLDQDLTVRIVDVAEDQRASFSRLDLRVVHHAPTACADLTGKRLRLSWYAPHEVAVGALVVITARLQRPWGMRNPGGFNYERWLLANRYAATGYVRQLRVIAPTGEAPANSATARLPHTLVNYGLIRALAFGAKGAVGDAEWRLFRRTGTVHLMVISGLHVSVLGSVSYGLVIGLMRLVPALFRRVPSRHVARTAALCVIWFYAVTAGLGAPVLRASVMASVVVTLALGRRATPIAIVYVAAAVTVTAVDPLQLFHQGFWLSFGAVGCLLLLFAPRRRRSTWVRSLLGCQVMLTLCLAPFLSLLTDEVPVVGMLANLVAVPFMSLAIVPALFVGVLALHVFDSEWVLHGVDIGLSVLLECLRWFDGWDFPTMGPRGFWLCTVALLGGILTTLPTRPALRLAAFVGSCALVLPGSQAIPRGHFQLRILDVGQGNAALVETAGRRVLVDTGPSFASGFNAASAVVIPTLRRTGRDRLDMLLVSHGDNDHAGGVDVVLERYPDTATIGADGGCEQRRWQWDGVWFATLYVADAVTSNSRSCTLLISGSTTHAYLGGDIPRHSEHKMIARLPAGIDLLLVPHHGSSTSSSWAFLRHLRPRIAIFSAGRANRYGHPKPDVVHRYSVIGAVTSTTGHDGAVVWRSWWPEICTTQRGTGCS